MALGPVSCEFNGVNLGDERLTERAGLIANRLSQNPKESIPLTMKTESETEAAYRFLRNKKVTLQGLLKTHFDRTTLRMEQIKECLVIHDTTDFEFGGEEDREDMGWVRHSRKGKVKKNGMFGHFALAAELKKEVVIPLGVIGVNTFVRQGKPKWKKHGKTLKRVNTKELETAKWGQLVKTVRSQIGEKIETVHVMDSGGDAYSVLSELVQDKERFVIRICHDRSLKEPEEFDGLFSFLEEQPWLFEREVGLSPRKKTTNVTKSKKHPARKKRMASLRFSSGEVEIKRPKNLAGEFPSSLKLTVVRAFEVNVPEGEPAVEWKIVTTEPCKSEQDVAKIIDIYQARWTIEDYFKSLKTGCSIEKRQLESRQTIEGCLALTIPIAWQLLLIRSMARMEHAHDSEKLLTSTQLKILRHLPETKLNGNPTNKEILLAVARLGGHIKNNGDPGWIVLGRGYQYLLTIEKGWNVAQKM